MVEGNAFRERLARSRSATGAVAKVPPSIVEGHGDVGRDSVVTYAERREAESPPDYEGRSGDRRIGGSRTNRDAGIGGGGT